MRGLDPRRALADELQELGAEQPHRAGRQPVGAVVIFRILPDRLEIGAKDERRAVDQEDMAAGADWFMREGHRAHCSGKDGVLSRLMRRSGLLARRPAAPSPATEADGRNIMPLNALSSVKERAARAAPCL